LQHKTLALVMAASAEVTQAASVTLAGPLAVQLGLHVRSALTRFSRQLRHKRINARRLTAPGLRVLPAERERLLLALDWTEWHRAWRMLVAAVIVCCRAIPVQAVPFAHAYMSHAQHLREWCIRRSIPRI
jgi:hypothetical protein